MCFIVLASKILRYKAYKVIKLISNLHPKLLQTVLQSVWNQNAKIMYWMTEVSLVYAKENSAI